MKLLIDTQLLLWCASSPQKIKPGIRKLLTDASSQLYFSAASLWEISIKNALGRKDFSVDNSLLRQGLLDNLWQELPVSGNHALQVERLPDIHKDPFDRMLIAQCMEEGMVLVTTDKTLKQYPITVRI